MERRRRRGWSVAVVAASIAIAGGCSSSSHRTEPPSATTTSTAPATTATAPAETTSTEPPAPSTTSVSVTNGVVTIEGRGDLTVPLPSSVPLPAIVHARHADTGSFVVSSVDSIAHRIAIVASSLGPYDGTFPVGFVNAAADPTTSLRIATRGTWHLDIGRAGDAPDLGAGTQAVGDAVLSYQGPAATAHLTYRGRARLVVNVYENGGLIPLVTTKGPFDGSISLIAGPEFIAVTTTGKWSMIIQ